MRHRAVLFSVLGVFFMVAGFDRSLQVAAFIAGFASIVRSYGSPSSPVNTTRRRHAYSKPMSSRSSV
jgi:hypothetical protein